MPLTAIIQSTQERVVIYQEPERAKAHRDELICPYCDQPLIPVRDHWRQGAYVQAYARHKDTRDHYQTEYRYHPESLEHLAAKAHLATEASAIFGLDVARYDFEVRLPEVSRIADVQLELTDGEIVIVEAQLAAITPEELEERTNDYEQLGYTVCWCLGKDANKKYNYDWCMARTGVCGVLDFDEMVISGAQQNGRIAA